MSNSKETSEDEFKRMFEGIEQPPTNILFLVMVATDPCEEEFVVLPACMSANKEINILAKVKGVLSRISTPRHYILGWRPAIDFTDPFKPKLLPAVYTELDPSVIGIAEEFFALTLEVFNKGLKRRSQLNN